MAQTGFTPISNYYSATATNVPTAGNLVAGELAINTADGKLFYKDSAGVVQTMASKATTAGTYSSITTSNLTIGTTQLGAGNASIMKNRIINGAMVISQYNGTSSVAVASGAGVYTIDRWKISNQTDGALTSQQVSDAPTGFNFSTKLTVTTADSSLASGQFVYFAQWIEGFNTADLGFGTANAKPVTLSFWVKSSLTGTFGGSITNENVDRSYPFNYTISSANTWTQISVSLAGDTTGTWIGATNGLGVRVFFGLGCGTTFSGTANAWGTASAFTSTGAVPVISTNAATWQVTGVQLEVGSSATGFDYRIYSTELINCQRYYFLLASGTDKQVSMATYYNSTYLTTATILPVTMRTTPSLVQTSGTNYYGVYTNGTLDTFSSFAAIADGSNQSVGLNADTNISGTSGAGGRVRTNDASAYLAFSAEL